MKNRMQHLICHSRIAVVCGLLLAVTGCADHATFAQAATMQPVGFWDGLWHGMILPISWLVSLFDSHVAIYAIYNNGGWYNFGFVLGCGALSSSTTAASRK